MSREEEFCWVPYSFLLYSTYFLLFVIIEVCRVLFVKIVKPLIRNRK